MELLDKDEQRWCCYDDDEMYFAKEQRWSKEVTSASVSQPTAITESTTTSPIEGRTDAKVSKTSHEAQVKLPITTSDIRRSASNTRLLMSAMLLLVAGASMIYLVHPSILHVSMEVSSSSSTSTSTYVSYGSHFVITTISTTTSSETCKEEACRTLKFTTTSYSSYHTTELALSTQYEQTKTLTHTTSRTETIPPYATLDYLQSI